MSLVLFEGIDRIRTIMSCEEDSLDAIHGYIDRSTGEVLVGSSDYPIENIPDEDDDEVPEELHHRYLPIPHMGATDSYEDMVDFIGSVEDERLRDLLSVAIKGKGAFGRFKDVLRREEYKDEQERWFSFCNQAETARVIQWLKTEGLSVGSCSDPQ